MTARRGCGAALLAFAACGGPSPEDAVHVTAEQYSAALASGDADKACELTSSDAKRELPGGDCPAAMKLVLKALPGSSRRDLRDFSPTKIVIKGDRATAEDDKGGNRVIRLGLVRDGDRWLIAADPNHLTGPA